MQAQYLTSEIILVNAIDEEVSHQCAMHHPSTMRLYHEAELLIGHVKDIITEAHIATNVKKSIIIAAHSFRLEAQNALLKILEEPPPLVHFLLISTNKTAFIPTIRSRCILTDKRAKEQIPPFAFSLTTMSLDTLYNYITALAKDHSDSKIHGKSIVASLLQSVAQEGIKLNEEELAMFDEALYELEHYRPKHLVCLSILLMLYHKAQRARKQPAHA